MRSAERPPGAERSGRRRRRRPAGGGRRRRHRDATRREPERRRRRCRRCPTTRSALAEPEQAGEALADAIVGIDEERRGARLSWPRRRHRRSCAESRRPPSRARRPMTTGDATNDDGRPYVIRVRRCAGSSRRSSGRPRRLRRPPRADRSLGGGTIDLDRRALAGPRIDVEGGPDLLRPGPHPGEAEVAVRDGRGVEALAVVDDGQPDRRRRPALDRRGRPVARRRA